MTLLSWGTALVVAGIAVPLLLLLYFLKLRRLPKTISSTLLWKKAIQDLQVNAPFQKLRKNLLLFLQLLILAALILGIANPVAKFMKTPERNIVLLIDRSASMKTVEADGRPRLTYAQDAAVQFVRDLPDNSRAMVIGFADSPNVVCTFTDDKRRLERLIRDIQPTDATSKLGDAMTLAVAYSSSFVEEAAGPGVPQAGKADSTDLELFSDGRIADADQQAVTRGQMRYFRIGQAVDNVGITAFDVRRDLDRPGMLSIFAQIENFGPAAVKTDVSISLDGSALPGPGSIREVALGPAAATSQTASAQPAGALPAAQSIVFELQHEAGGVVQVKIHRPDALACDNVVSAPIDPPRQVRILAVSDRAAVRKFLTRALHSLEIEDVTIMSPSEYEAAADKQLAVEGRSAFDLVFIDNHDTDRLPPGNYVFFSALPKIAGVSAGEEVSGQPVVYGQQNHPLLRNVNYEGLYVAKWRRLTLPASAQPLLEGEDSVVMALLSDIGHRYVVTAFDLLDSDFPIKYAFPIFVQNAVRYLAAGGVLDVKRLIAPGQTLTVQVPPGAEKLRITRPDGHVEKLDAAGKSTLSFSRTRDVGVYKAEFDDPKSTTELFAANLLDSTESFIAPKDAFTLGAEKIASVSGQTKVNEPLWPYLAGAALAFVLVEWWFYNRRVMI